MSRNTEQHFSQVPHAEIRRSTFKRPFSLLTTMNEGDLVPIYLDEVLPGDTFKIDQNSLIRMATPLYPVMDNCDIDFYYFFVPTRLIWDHFVNMMGQNDSTYWAETTEYTTPLVKGADHVGFDTGSIADYMGVPTTVEYLEVNVLPFRAYAKIWNEWFRDENLQQPVTVHTDDVKRQAVTIGYPESLEYVELGGTKPLKVGKHKDYFTSCLPQPQKGDAIKLPLGQFAPVTAYTSENFKPTPENPKIETGIAAMYQKVGTSDLAGQITNIEATNGNKYTTYQGFDQTTGNTVTAYLMTNLAEATATTINELRNAIAVQHILERDARTGTRYKEILKGAWGVTSPDARLDRTEYIGGMRVPININQVIQTSATNTTSPQGNTGAYSMTTSSNHMCTYSATEHGYVIGLATIRVQHSYQQGLRRLWTRSTRFSYYDPMLANLGEQAVLNQEIFARGNAQDEEVFGYQEAWADYKYRTNEVTGQMRSQAFTGLDAWHYADYYTATPKLSTEWIMEDESNINRTIAVESEKGHQFICNFYFENTWTRPMPVYNIPGLDTI